MKKNVYLYCRRSSEGEDKQMLSLPSQVKELKQYAKKIDVNIIKTFEESMSAKAPGRPMFAEMMSGLANKQAEGILCWKLDRLARNPVDGGAISWAMKDLKVEIFTPAKTYSQLNEDGLLMSLEFGMAQKFIDDLGKNSQRGMRTKAESGWYPAPAPLGYKNTPDRKKGFKIIEVDEEKFSLVRRLFTEIIAGKQPSQVYEEASKTWKLTSQLGTVLCKSGFNKLLTKTFYYGEYEWPMNSGKWYKSSHTPMITRDEFDAVQIALGKKGRPIARKHTFDLTGLFRCSVCGCAMTATVKSKYYKETGRKADYVYYYCTKKNKSIKCNSKPLTKTDVMKQINEILSKVSLDIEFITWAKKWMSAIHKNESYFQQETLESQQRALLQVETRLNKLLDALINGLIDEATYKEKKAILEKEKFEIQAKIDNTTNNLDGWRGKVENTLDFALGCQHRFNTGTREDKQEILLRLGKNLLFNPNKTLEIKLKPEFQVMADKQKWNSQYIDWQEPQKYTEIMEKNDDLRPANPCWLPL